MDKKVLAGSSGDHRWLPPINPNEPQTIKETSKPKEDFVKGLRDQNSALNSKLNSEVEKLTGVSEENRRLVGAIEKLELENKSLKSQLQKVTKEVEDVLSAEKQGPGTAKKIVAKKVTQSKQGNMSSKGA